MSSKRVRSLDERDNMIKTLAIEGLRGFYQKQNISFSLPNNKIGSGLNIIVGPNNSGKSTIVEAIKAFNGVCSFSEGKRNSKTENGVCLELIDDGNKKYSIKTKVSGGSEVDRTSENDGCEPFLGTYILPSRRFVDYEFGKGTQTRKSYVSDWQNLFGNRRASLGSFPNRLFKMLENKGAVNKLLSQILGSNIDWTIEQRDNENYYVKFRFGEVTHSSEGVGDGLWSVLTICDALYDSGNSQTIVIDEPELSIHPLYQKKIMKLLLDYSKDRQIIVCTHSPYFVDWNAISNGASLIRTSKSSDGSIHVHQISEEFRKNVSGFLNDVNNPHVLGLEANEAFFLDDNIIITEGQEDVVAYNKINQEMGIELKGQFFGWGCGGASKETIILRLLSDLGFKNVAAIFDGDKQEEFENCKKLFPYYNFFILPTDDVRDKKERTLSKKNGLSTLSMELKEEYKDSYLKLMADINNSFNKGF